MSFDNCVCKTCGVKFHCCSCCDNIDTLYLEHGFCSWECAGKEYIKKLERMTVYGEKKL